MRISPGRPYPLGVTWDRHGVNVALFSEHATGVDFCLFDENNPQSTCCPAGVGGNVLGLCALLVCQ